MRSPKLRKTNECLPWIPWIQGHRCRELPNRLSYPVFGPGLPLDGLCLGNPAVGMSSLVGCVLSESLPFLGLFVLIHFFCFSQNLVNGGLLCFIFYLFSFVCADTHAYGTRGWHLASSLITLYLICWGTFSPLSETHQSSWTVWAASSRTSLLCIHSTSVAGACRHVWPCTWVLSIQIYILMLAQ